MKTSSRKWIALLLALAMFAMLTACALEEKPDKKAYSEKERSKVAVTVGGKYDITKGEIIDQYEYLLNMYQYYGMEAPIEDADIESLQDSVISDLVSSKILLYQAEQLGITLDDMKKAELEAELESEMQYWIDEFASQAVSEGAADIEARTEELFNNALSESNMDMDMKGYREYLSNVMEEKAILSILEEIIRAKADVGEEQIQAYYEHLLKIQEDDYSETPANYQTDSESYLMNGGNPVVFRPKGYIRVKAIAISPEEELDEDYAALREEVDKMESEYGRLMLEDAESNEERLLEIEAEYVDKKAEADEMYEDFIKDARDKINEAYTALEEGKPFDKVLEEYGEDDIYKTNPMFTEKGILMLRDGEEDINKDLVEAALALKKEGMYSEIIQIDDVFYIVLFVGSEPSKPVPLSEVYDEIEELALNEASETLWREQQETWNNDTSQVVYNDSVYRDIGKKK